MAAPTGRAAKRMSEATGFEAKTLHRLLEAQAVIDDSDKTRFLKNENNLLEADVYIIDEMSMVDVFLFAADDPAGSVAVRTVGNYGDAPHGMLNPGGKVPQRRAV